MEQTNYKWIKLIENNKISAPKKTKQKLKDAKMLRGTAEFDDNYLCIHHNKCSSLYVVILYSVNTKI